MYPSVLNTRRCCCIEMITDYAMLEVGRPYSQLVIHPPCTSVTKPERYKPCTSRLVIFGGRFLRSALDHGGEISLRWAVGVSIVCNDEGMGDSRLESKRESLRWRGLGLGRCTRSDLSAENSSTGKKGRDRRTQPAKQVTNVNPPAT